jgi:4-hydroxythreonine-4-phosphate dehydrogenase
MVHEPTSTAPIAITMGDPCGIGPEILLKAIAKAPNPQALVAVGDPQWLAAEAMRLKLPAPPRIERAASVPADLRHGQVDPRAGDAAWRSIVHATRLAQAGAVRAVVTAPISKEAMQAAGHHYPGHTELLAELAGGVEVRMMLANAELRVVLVSIHVALSEAVRSLTAPSIVRTLKIADRALRAAGLSAPRIAVAGLNPHAGEAGLFGREEIDIIAPAIAEARAQGIDARGPFAPDTVFMRARGLAEFDAVIAMYHDQGLIPIKYLGLDQGVNITIGLPFVRTSPDHGTAFDLAGRPGPDGRGLADPASLIAAIAQADALSASGRL